MIPVLYSSTEIDFTGEGLGELGDTTECQVAEERNGIYELSLKYPVEGVLYKQIRNDCIIKAKPNDTSKDQIFRVYRISKPFNGVVTVSAEHISYELNSNPVQGFTATGSAQTALQALLDAAILPHSFTAQSDIDLSKNTSIQVPCSVRACLGGQKGSVLDIWGGEYEFDNYRVILHQNRGRDTGVSIEYGKNLTDILQDENNGNTVTGILPYAMRFEGDDATYYYISEKVLYAKNASNFARPKIVPVDLSDKFGFEEEITEAELRKYGQAYIEENAIGVPKVNIKVSFVPLWQSPEYVYDQLLERVSLCDTVTVRFEKLGVDAKTKVIKTTYDTLKERYSSIELGDAKSNFASTVKNIQTEVTEIQKTQTSMPSKMQKAVDTATELITGAIGGNVVIGKDATGKPNEILFMDTDDKATAVNVLRINQNGIGFSKTGYNGPFYSAWTIDGAFNADFITAGSLVADIIKTGILKSSNGKCEINMDTGECNMSGTFRAEWKFSDGQTGVIVLNPGGLTLTKDGVHQASIYTSVGDEGIVKANRFIVYVNEQTQAKFYYDPDDQKTKIQVDELVGALNCPQRGAFLGSTSIFPGGISVSKDGQVKGSIAMSTLGDAILDVDRVTCENLNAKTCAWKTITINGTNYNVLVGE